MKRLWPVLLAPLLIAATCACQPTGHPRCDRIAFYARSVIEDHGWRLDCTPGFSNWSPQEGRYVAAWDDSEHHTVWVWTDTISVYVNRGSDDAMLLRTITHEAAHTTGITSECKADEWAYKHLKPAEREGIGFLAC